MNSPATSATFPSSHKNQYDHTQRSPIPWLILIPAAVIIAIVIAVSRSMATNVGVLIAIGALPLVAFSFQWLRITDEGEALLLRFGPIPLFRKRFHYAKIAAAEADKTSSLDGIGIHWVPRRGWTYNIWGVDCVRLTLTDGRTVRIGTDDPNGLARFLQQKCAPRPVQR